MKELFPDNISAKLDLPHEDRGYITRAMTRGDLMVPPVLLRISESSFLFIAPNIWNGMPVELRTAETLAEFKNLYFEYFMFT